MTEEIIIDKEDKTKKHRNNEIDCLHFGCRKGKNSNVLFWCDFYDDHCDNYTGCYYRKYLRLEQENKELAFAIEKCLENAGIECDDEEQALRSLPMLGNAHYKVLVEKEELEQENKELKEKIIELSEEKGHLIVENNTLKESNQSLSMLGTDLVSANETVRKEFFRADKNKDMWRETAEKYRSALEDIKRYAEERCRQKVLDKINEVLN